MADARVTLSNSFDTRVAVSAEDGTFTLTFDGADTASGIVIEHATHRPLETSASITALNPAVGTLAIMANDEILFATQGTAGGLYMVHANGLGLERVVDAQGDTLTTPCRSASGLTIRWANLSKGTVHEAAWNGAGVQEVYRVDAAYLLQGISWSNRGTFVARTAQTDGSTDIIIAEDPPGTTFNYAWSGDFPDASPPVFGSFGPQPIAGNMLCFAGTVTDYQGTGETKSGLFTVFPYFADSFLVPELVDGTQAADLYPRWSAYRSDGSLDLAFQRSYDLYLSHVTSDGEQNVFSAPAVIYGSGADDVNVNRFAWAPESVGQPDGLVLAVNAFSSGSTLAEPGDLVVISYDASTGVVGAPTVIFDASAAGDAGLALSVAWR